MKNKITCRPRYNPWLKKYLNTKTFSKILAFGILINSMPISSLAGMLSEDGRYETFEGDNITIDNILEEDKVNVEVEGNTLVNLIDIKNESNLSINGDDTLVKRIIKSEGKYRWEKQISTGNAFYPKIYISKNDTNLIQSNKIYSIQYRISSSQILDSNFQIENGDKVLPLEIIYDEKNLNHGITIQTEVNNNNSILVKKVFRINSIENLRDISIIFSHVTENVENTKYPQWVEISDLVLLEGDWSNEEIPSYFKGLKSVGELAENNIKIEYKNKNILPDNFINKSWVEPYRANARIASEFISYKKNTSYTVYGLDGNVYKDVFIEYSNEIYELGATDNINITRKRIAHFTRVSSVTFTPNPNYKYMAVYTYSLDYPNNYVDIAKISVCEGDTPPLEYIKSESKDFNINLSEPLRGIEGSVKDKIIKKNGQWIIERNCGEVIFDGSDDENWIIDTGYNSSTHIRFKMSIPNVKYGDTNIHVACDKFASASNHAWGNSNEQVDNDSKGLNINILKAKLPTQNIDGFKEWLSKNPTKIVYRLQNPIYEPIDFNAFQLYLDTTHISTDSTIPANLKVTVDRVANRAKEYGELAKENPTIKNISLARMWTNSMRESILKDEFQDNIDSISEIVDLQLERKISSSNIDVYIKSENMLSMSLDTNSIMFDDFSGVEDIEKINAVNININSSLPYQLNAYLPVEIQNTDKTNTMDKQILNIKENSEADYKEFKNINEKVVLKDNCTAGNDLIHGVDIKLKGGIAHEKDAYKTTIKFEAEQK